MLQNLVESLPGELIPALEREFKSGLLREAVQCELNEKRLGKINSNSHRSVEGLGRFRLSIPAEDFHFVGQKYGYAAWRDPGFLRDYEKRCPASRVRCSGTKFMMGWEPTGKKFKKIYSG